MIHAKARCAMVGQHAVIFAEVGIVNRQKELPDAVKLSIGKMHNIGQQVDYQRNQHKEQYTPCTKDNDAPNAAILPC